MNGLNVNLKTNRYLGKENYALAFFHVFSSYLYPPTHYAAFEPIKIEWNSQQNADFCNLWMSQSCSSFGQILLRRRSKPSYYASVQFIRGPKANNNSVSIYGMSQHFHQEKKKFKSFLELVDELFPKLDFAYGRVCLEDDFQEKNIVLNYRHENGSVEPRKPVGINWAECLPGIYWCNYFGMPYVTWFGKDKLLSTPCFEAKVLSSDCIRILAYNYPTAFQDRNAKEAEYIIREHLGSNSFFDKSLTSCSFIAPDLDFSDLRSNVK